MRGSIYLPVAAIVGAVLLAASAGNAETPDRIPVPARKPEFSNRATRVAAEETTNAIAATAEPVSSDLKAGLDALSSKQPAAAIAARNAMGEGTLDRHILTWAIAVSGQRGVPSLEIADAQRELRGWPGLKSLRANSERALYRENPPAADVLAAFGNTQPETTEGTLILARALVARGQTDAAAKRLRAIWQGEALDKDTETKILTEFSGLLTAGDHQRRMAMLLYRNRVEQAERFGDLGKAQSLYRAWAAVSRGGDKATALIAAVDPSWRKDPAYLFIQIEALRKDKKYAEAAKLLSRMPKDSGALVNPGEWWVEQRVVSRGLLDAGDFRGAYRIAAGHLATEATDVVDAEFHAGWYALRGLEDPATAARHFRRILDVSNRPLSASRAWYWLGRSAEAGGPGTAGEYFTNAARYPGTFYGQLAAARLGRKTLNVAYPAPTADDRARFENREAVRAITRLETAGHAWRADSLYRALADELTSPGELALLSARAEKTGNHQLSLQVGKIAFGRGIDVAALAFPVGVIPPNANIDGSGKALAYAIARQESAFNPAAISTANARGLLQLMPGTAKGVASRYGLAYSQDRLTSDAGYNATLGAHYLGEQINSFGGSYILTFIAYNAGPRRVPEWLGRYGDPRGKPIDEVVDWIERIPFQETRNYVQRVMENYQVYKSRLGQKADIVEDLRMGRQ
ncbi:MULTISPECIES: lytic transglycosylase domain-containing protein [unclassified Ensifer]|uniref:lytic transglycosylase domain-containing protein n=1 Tax=unclassified Ensifer TaxID=2633371 RepID=UPI00081316C6|nr:MULTISPECIES: lytic transglycosylase domain-containing protein [unclassified Ensifer]OCO98201.1 lytic transglycosylase [Ensifer sp. LC14]OCP03842.1 lytic transglycosylase [Ensifer sp. LC11]OCP04183.1 lytic transglycosylase [Ensifer sp. LC13]OCP30373.1 lytic transglycosylase [Ensifer sp. LC499]